MFGPAGIRDTDDGFPGHETDGKLTKMLLDFRQKILGFMGRNLIQVLVGEIHGLLPSYQI